MKSLFEIQQEVRLLEQQVALVTKSITEIYKDIDSLRNEEVVLIDYKKIYLLSTRIKFKDHPLGKLSDKKLCQAYIELLLRLMDFDKSVESTINRLVFVQWLAKQAKSELSLEELFKGALKRDLDNLIFVMESLPSAYKNQLIMDSLLLANICGKANEAILLCIGDLCGFFNVNKDKLKAFSIIAKSILQQDIEVINKDNLGNVTLYTKQFEHYFESDALLRGICKQRRLVARINEHASYELGWKQGTGYYVNKGDVICTYRSFLKNKNDNKCIIEAPCEGKLYIFKDKSISYVVIHNEKDNLTDVKAWALLRR